jgi:probable phosphoglycerate mutase
MSDASTPSSRPDGSAGPVRSNGKPRVFPQLRFRAPPGATELLLVRHGESQAVVEGESHPLHQGHGDPPLSDEGRTQADRLADRLDGEEIHAIYITPLQRTAETAAPLAARLGLAPVIEADLREVFLGEWEAGLFRQKMQDRDPIAVRMVAEQRWDVIPGAESSESFAARVRAGVTRIVAAHPDQRVVVVAHGGTIGEILRQATGSSPWAFAGGDNASISHLVITPERWIVRRFNDSTHIEAGFTIRPAPLS